MRNVFLLIFSLCSLLSFSQKTLVDEMVAVVGSEIILRSEVEQQANQMYVQGYVESNDFNTLCDMLEEMVFQKMMLAQAQLDSLQVSEDQVEQELNRRVQYFIQQIGGREKLEQYMGKSIEQMKSDFRESIKNQLLVTQMQQKITGSVKVTPSEVKDFYHSIPKDSLPYIPAELQIGQIVIIPPIREEEKQRVKRELNELRDQILAGSKFSLKARIYSEDPGSAEQGGELGFLRREDLVPEFAGAAFSLKEGEVSEVIETEYGFHIIQLIEKRGELANFRHILMKPKVSASDLRNAEKRLDSVYYLIRNKEITFQKAAETYSMDEDTRNNGGLLINMSGGGGTKFSMDELDAFTYQSVSGLKVGEMTRPAVFDMYGGKKAVRVLYLVSKTEPHVADLSTDYQRIMQAALANKQNKAMEQWVFSKKDELYVRIDNAFKDCDFKVKWFDRKTK